MLPCSQSHDFKVTQLKGREQKKKKINNQDVQYEILRWKRALKMHEN